MRRHLVQRADMVGHQVWTGGAIHAHGQQIMVRDRRVQRVDSLAAQHGSGTFDRDRGDDRNLPPKLCA